MSSNTKNTHHHRLYQRLFFITSLVLILVSCVQVQVVDRNNTSTEDPTAALHNLSAAGIIFEPPLDEIGRSVLRHGVDLFVQVENNGLYDESDVSVQVTLKAEGQSDPLAEQQTLISDIASGETQKVHFRLTELVDLYDHYILHVSVSPCLEETFLQDNQRTFDLYVTPIP